jgi:hypothetical protein
MKYKNIEKGKVYKMKSLEDILKIEGSMLGEEGLLYKGEYMSISVMEDMYGKEVRVMSIFKKKYPLNIGINLADNTHCYPYMQEIPVKFLKKLDKDSEQ